MADRPPTVPEPPIPFTILDPPETELQSGQSPPGGVPQDRLSAPNPLPDLTPVPSDPSLSLAQNLEIAAVKARLADHDTPITQPHRLSVVFRHTGWYRNRLLIYQSLHRTEQSFSRQANFANCGADAYVLQNVENPGVYRIAGSACHDRFCLPCAQERSQAIALNVLELTAGRRIRFLTLTLKTTDQPLAVQLDRLYAAFQALRRRKLWKDKVTGGVAFLEITWSTKLEAWHPHFHILIEGSYLPHQHLKKLWYQITGDSYIIDIRTVRDLDMASRYVTKYASKAFDNTFLNRQDCLDEAVIAFKGRKLLLTFGTWRGIALIEKPSDGAWDHVAPLETILVNAAHGDADATAIVRALTNADMTAIYERAPPLPLPPARIEPPVTQLDWFGVWAASGIYAYPSIESIKIA